MYLVQLAMVHFRVERGPPLTETVVQGTQGRHQDGGWVVGDSGVMGQNKIHSCHLSLKEWEMHRCGGIGGLGGVGEGNVEQEEGCRWQASHCMVRGAIGGTAGQNGQVSGQWEEVKRNARCGVHRMHMGLAKLLATSPLGQSPKMDTDGVHGVRQVEIKMKSHGVGIRGLVEEIEIRLEGQVESEVQQTEARISMDMAGII
ncbi:hypothetical protein EDD18DRAFT_1113873 [Armillaria luteobubalina]|uniref:Uncharacterized protein n=1 Tax=Armillaria luteobubalina TaxID=153913 RepID=A0AA39P8T6_9AGAR|nr:hypothetical protein EDD18DRAFT_1113873 [Armillaria luteobubalina]